MVIYRKEQGKIVCCVFILLISVPMIYISISNNRNLTHIHESNTFVASDTTFDEWLFQNSRLFQDLTTQVGRVIAEGHIFQQDKLTSVFTRKPQIFAYFNYITQHRDTIYHVCETGFNGGHSALFWAVLFKGNIEITAFDLCVNKGCDIGEKEIKKIFPNITLTLVRGDSRKTVKEFARTFPNKKCDFISIDGGHVGDVPMEDIKNMKKLARNPHVIVMDDVNKHARLPWIKIPGIAWDTAVSDKIICPLDKCKSVFTVPNNKFPLKFCFGRYC